MISFTKDDHKLAKSIANIKHLIVYDKCFKHTDMDLFCYLDDIIKTIGSDFVILTRLYLKLINNCTWENYPDNCNEPRTKNKILKRKIANTIPEFKFRDDVMNEKIRYIIIMYGVRNIY